MTFYLNVQTAIDSSKTGIASTFSVDAITSSHTVPWAIFLADSVAESERIRTINVTIVTVDSFGAFLSTNDSVITNLNGKFSVTTASRARVLEAERSSSIV